MSPLSLWLPFTFSTVTSGEQMSLGGLVFVMNIFIQKGRRNNTRNTQVFTVLANCESPWPGLRAPFLV